MYVKLTFITLCSSEKIIFFVAFATRKSEKNELMIQHADHRKKQQNTREKLMP